MKAICYNPILLSSSSSSSSSSLHHHPNSNPLFIPYLNSTRSSKQFHFPWLTRQPRTNPFRPKCLLSEWQQGANQGEELRVLTSMRTEYNDILIVDTPESRFLLLDSTHNVHSMFNKGVGDNWTGSYWDEFAALPAIVPEGVIGIYGLGGGTAARLMLELWPGVRILGWDIDEVLVDAAREFLGLAEIEQPNSSGGFVEVRIGDVFGDEAQGVKYAGIAVDLFAGGKVLGDLEKVETWVEMKGRLMPGGRIIANCAGGDGDEDDSGGSHRRGSWRSNATIRAMKEAFPGELWWKRMARDEGENYLALTGKDLDRDSWSAKVRGRLRKSVRDWRERATHDADGGCCHRGPCDPWSQPEPHGREQRPSRDRYPHEVVPQGPEVVESDPRERLSREVDVCYDILEVTFHEDNVCRLDRDVSSRSNCHPYVRGHEGWR